MIIQILKLADYFDQVGLHKKADQLDNLIVKISEDFIKYTVKSGNTLGQIAIDHGVSVSDIQAANNMGDRTDINADDVIKIPSPKKNEPQGKTSLDSSNSNNAFTHKVESGDTISEIAQEYGITTSELQEANNMVGRTNIMAGQKLVIPGDYPAEVVAATLLGEVGTTDPNSMASIMKVIKNRASAKGVSDLDIVMEKGQFEYWSRNPDVSRVLSSNMGRKHKLWGKAFDIASGKEELPDVGGATHYYTGDVPSWADSSKNKCWTQIENPNDPLHIYGIDKSIRAYNGGKYCDPKAK
jgi:LysM repeat protein